MIRQVSWSEVSAVFAAAPARAASRRPARDGDRVDDLRIRAADLVERVQQAVGPAREAGRV